MFRLLAFTLFGSSSEGLAFRGSALSQGGAVFLAAVNQDANRELLSLGLAAFDGLENHRIFSVPTALWFSCHPTSHRKMLAQ